MSHPAVTTGQPTQIIAGYPGKVAVSTQCSVDGAPVLAFVDRDGDLSLFIGPRYVEACLTKEQALEFFKQCTALLEKDV